MHRLGLLLLLLGSAWSSSAAAKRLIVFGDSISDNGNGTNAMGASILQPAARPERYSGEQAYFTPPYA